MRRKTGISLMMALLMVVSTFVVATVDVEASGTYPIGVSKTVWNGDGWAETTTANMGDTVKFKITITYEPNCPAGNQAMYINVTDTLPPCLSYDDNAVITYGVNTFYGESGTSGLHVVFWNLTKDYGIRLWHQGTPSMPSTVTITFDATVIGYTDQDGEQNEVHVTAWEHCCDWGLEGDDDATVIVEEPSPGIQIIKKVKDGANWVDSVTVDEGDDVEFKLKIKNTGNVDLTNVNVTDDLPSFLTYNYNATGSPTVEQDHHIEWELGTLTAGSNKNLFFSAHADEPGDDNNSASVEGDYGCTTYSDDDKARVVVEEVTFPDIELIKKVWNGASWTDSVTVYVDDNVEFKITVTNTGDVDLTDVQVTDTLPSFLTYNYDANLTPSFASAHLIKWNLGTLTVGSSKEITFSAHVDSIGEGDNLARVTTCQQVNDEDEVHVIVAGMIVEKEVWNGNAWVEEVDASVEDIIKFRIIIYYYGDGTYDLYNIKVKDELPECLEYADNANPVETYVSPDKKIIWWNLSIHIRAGGSTSIIFNARIIETSGCGPCFNWARVTGKECSGNIFYSDDSAKVNAECPVDANAGGPYSGKVDENIQLTGSATGGTEPYTFEWDLDYDGITFDVDATGESITESWSSPGTYNICLNATDSEDRWDTDETHVSIGNNPPNKPSKPSGTTGGKAGKEYTYYSTATDPDGDQIYYKFDWGDGSYTDTELYDSGAEGNASHVWGKGSWEIKVRAIDEHGAGSEWSDPLVVSMPKNKQLINLEPGIYVENIKKMSFPITIVVGSIDIKVDATDDDGINRVEFYLDDELEATDDTAPYSWKWDEFSFGPHTLKIIVYDSAGNGDTDEMTVWKFF